MDFPTPRRGPPPLVETCLKIAIRHSNFIYDFGPLPLKFMLPIMRHVDNVEQLLQLQLGSPEFAADFAPSWHRILRKKYPRIYHERQPLADCDYPELYLQLKDLDEKALAEAQAKLEASMSKLTKEREENTTRIVSSKEVPRMPAPRRRNYGASPAPAKTAGGRIMQKVRQEVRTYSQHTRLVTATGSLPVRAGQIKEAPKAMVEDRRIAKNPSIRIKAPKRKKPPTEQDSRESRLLAIKNKALGNSSSVAQAPKPAYNGLADLFSDEDDEKPQVSMKRSRADDEVEPRPAISGTGPKRPRIDSGEAIDQGVSKPTQALKTSLSSAPKMPEAKPSPVRRTGGLLSNRPGASQRGVVKSVLDKETSANRTTSATVAKATAASQSSTASSTPCKPVSSTTSLKEAAAPTLSPRPIKAATQAPLSTDQADLAGSPPPRGDIRGNVALPADSSAGPRKKKPVDIFMRRKKVVR